MHRNQHGRAVLAVAAALAAGLAAAPLAARAQTFSAPVQINPSTTLDDAQGPQVAMDGVGNAYAFWDCDNGYGCFSMHAPGTAWTAPQAVKLGAQLGDVQMHVSANGFVSVANDGGFFGIIVVERLPDGTWTQPKKVASLTASAELVPIGPQNPPYMIYAGNPTGAQVIFYQTSTPSIMAVRRQGSGAWSAPETVVTPPSGKHAFRVAGGAIGANGDMLFAWEESNYSCTPTPCGYNNFTVHATRELASTPGWVDSPIPAINRPDRWVVAPLVDAAGRGGLLMQAGAAATALQATRQQLSNGVWGRLLPAYTDPSGGTLALWGASIGQKEQATYAAVNVNTTNSILVGDGNIVSQSWGAPVDLSAADASPPTAALAYGGNINSGAAVLWTDLDDTVRATLRTSGASAFLPAQTVIASDSCTSGGNPCRVPLSAAIDPAGDAVVLYLQEGGLSRLLAATTN